MTFSPESLEAAARQATPGSREYVNGTVRVDEETHICATGWTNDHASRAQMDADATLIALLSPERVMLLAELWKAAEEFCATPDFIGEFEHRLRDVLARLADQENP